MRQLQETLIPLFTFQYVSINIVFCRVIGRLVLKFTFQYVSINMEDRPTLEETETNLHSNMSLLI